MLPSTPPGPPPDEHGASGAEDGIKHGAKDSAEDGVEHGADGVEHGPGAGEDGEDRSAESARRALRDDVHDDLRAAGLLLVAAVVVGVPLGWWWQSMSPRTRAFVDSNGFVIPEESESQIGADMRALFLFAALGAVVGAGAWLWRSGRGPILLLGSTAAAAAGAVSVALCGRWFSGGATHGAARSVITLPVTLNGRPILLLAPIVCALVYVCCAIFATDDALGRRARPASDPAPGPQVFVLGADQRRRDDGGSDATYASASSIR